MAPRLHILGSFFVGLACCLGTPLVSMAQTPGTSVSAALDLYKNGLYQDAVAVGLSDLRSSPKNHELRFIVADSLQRLGKVDEAVLQFEALENTPYAAAAVMRLNALRGSRQMPSPKLVSNVRPPTLASSGYSAQPYQYVPPANPSLFGRPRQSELIQSKANPPEVAPVATSPKPQSAEQRIRELSVAEDYQAVGTEGLALLAQEKPDDSLQLVIANSLAWTGRLEEAVTTYQKLTEGKFANDANVGLANIERWRGRDDRAFPRYQAVLALDPSNAGALEGVELATRELVPRTVVSVGGTHDSSEIERKSATVSHRWRDRSGANIMEVELGGVKDSLFDNQVVERDVSLRYQALDLVLKPSLELSMPSSGNRNLYGKARLTFDEYQTSLDVGRVNWGKIAANPNALNLQLSASMLGVEAKTELSFGELTAHVDYFDISDGNALWTSSLRLASKWRPLGSHIKPFFGVETRETSFNTPNYWSPMRGFGTLYAGILAEWGQANWNFYTSAQTGAPLYGEAGTSWSLSAGGKRWVSRDLALSLNLWSMSSWRDNATYEAQAVTINLEKLWR